jgi:hypothetical protein
MCLFVNDFVHKQILRRNDRKATDRWKKKKKKKILKVTFFEKFDRDDSRSPESYHNLLSLFSDVKLGCLLHMEKCINNKMT